MSDSTVVVKSFSLSSKEEKLKNKLFGGPSLAAPPVVSAAAAQLPPRQQQPASSGSVSHQNTMAEIHSRTASQRKSLTSQQSYQSESPSNKSMTLSQRLSPRNQVAQQQYQQMYNAIPEEKVDKFLKQMEDELTNISKKQVSIGMLNSQTQIIKQQNDVLNQNQKQLALLMSKIKSDDSVAKQKQELIEQNKTLMEELLQPITEQIEEIREIHKQTRQAQADMKTAPASRQSLHELHKQNGQVKSRLDSTQQNLNGLLPDNLSTFSHLTNFNIDIYQKTINQLKVQVEELQKEAQRAEIELEDRQLKLQNLPNQQQLLLPIQENMQNQVDNIDFFTSYQIASNKLGGELDYDGFIDSLQEISSDVEDLWKEYTSEMVMHTITLPRINITVSEMNELSYQMPSVLDDIKFKLGLDPTKPMKNPNTLVKQQEQAQGFIDMAQQNPNPVTSYAKKQTLKPKNLDVIRTEPKQCPREVKYEKKDSRHAQFDTLFPAEQKQDGGFLQLTQVESKNNPPGRSSSTYEKQQSFSNNNNNNNLNQFGSRNASTQQQQQSRNRIADEDMQEDQFQQIDLDDNIIQNLADPFRNKKRPTVNNQTFEQKNNNGEDEYVQLSFQNQKQKKKKRRPSQSQPAQQQFDRNDLKNIFLEVLNENKDQFFGALLPPAGENQASNQYDQQSGQGLGESIENSKDKDDFLRQKLSDAILKENRDSSNFGKVQSQQKPQNNNSSQQIQGNNFNADRSNLSGLQQNQQGNNQQVQQQSQELALNFLNIINSTLASISSAVNVQPSQKSRSNNLGDVSEGSIDDDSMEAAAYGQQNNNRNPYSGQAGRTFMDPNNNAQTQMWMPQGMPQGMPGMPQPIYPGMMMPSTWMMPMQNMQQPMMQMPSNFNRTGGGGNEGGKIDINDFYKEFQLSDAGQSEMNQSELSMGQFEAKSSRSFADSIFQSDELSRSDGQVSVPGRKPFQGSKVKVENGNRRNEKVVLSDLELSQSNEEIPRNAFRRRQSDRESFQKNKKSIADDIWSEVSGELSEGQI